MEKLLFKKGRKGFRRDFIAALNPSLFRYATLHSTKRGLITVNSI
jgi:hypothetical protein